MKRAFTENITRAYIMKRVFFIYREVKMGILEKIAEIEREIGRTQKNKATEYHLGTLKEMTKKNKNMYFLPSFWVDYYQ